MPASGAMAARRQTARHRTTSCSSTAVRPSACPTSGANCAWAVTTPPTFWSWTVFDPFGTNGVGSATNLALGSAICSRLLAGTTYGTLVRANNMVAVHPAGRRVRSRPVWSGPGGCGRRRSRQQVLGWPHRLRRRSVRRRRCLWRDRCSIRLHIDLDQLEHRWFVELRFHEAVGLLQLDRGSTARRLNTERRGRDNWYVGVSAPFGQWNFKASYGGTNGSGSAVGNADATQWAIGADYNLSKRTALYATWSSINNDDRCASSPCRPRRRYLEPSATNSNGIQLGVRHSF